jgi:hypothetical protein
VTEAKKEGIFAKLFGAKKSCCCNVRIEEVTEETGKEDQAEAKRDGQSPSCCGRPSVPPAAGGKRDGAGTSGRRA